MHDVISQSVAESMEAASSIHESLSESIDHASNLAIEKLSNSGKLYFASCEMFAPIAQLTIDNFMKHKRHLRPPLPAIAIKSMINSEGLISENSLAPLLTEINALSEPRDCVILALSRCDASVIAAIDKFALETQQAIISILHSDSDRQPLAPRNQESKQMHSTIPLIVSSIARKQESTLFILNCLSAMIEKSLFGSVLDA